MAIIRGTAQGETLRGTPDADRIFALGGDDFVLAKAGNDLVDGGAGDDVLGGELGDDRLFGGDGQDFVFGGRGNDRAFGGTGDDTLSDEAAGPDGDDAFDGGAGRDSLRYDNQSVGVSLTLAEGAGTGRAVQAGEVDTVRNVEDVFGSLGNDVVFGNSAANFLSAIEGDDRLFGRGGSDELIGSQSAESTTLLDGGSGNDVLSGVFGRVTMLAGTGADRLFASPEFVGQSDVDRTDLGRDAARDVFTAGIDISDGALTQGLSTERVRNIGAQDRLDLTYAADEGGEPEIIRAADFLDSDGNGVVNDGDRDARLVGGNLVLDLDQLFERVDGTSADLGQQHVILENIARIDADQFI